MNRNASEKDAISEFNPYADNNAFSQNIALGKGPNITIARKSKKLNS